MLRRLTLPVSVREHRAGHFIERNTAASDSEGHGVERVRTRCPCDRVEVSTHAVPRRMVFDQIKFSC